MNESGAYRHENKSIERENSEKKLMNGGSRKLSL
jgi:hypothetical protein